MVKRVSERGEDGKSGVGPPSLRRRPCTPWIARNRNSPVTKRSLCRSWGGGGGHCHRRERDKDAGAQPLWWSVAMLS